MRFRGSTGRCQGFRVSRDFNIVPDGLRGISGGTMKSRGSFNRSQKIFRGSQGFKDGSRGSQEL